MARPLNVLFLCTHNSARSILAESILRRHGGERFRAFSAGSAPGGTVNPLAIRTLERMGYPTEGLRSKSWDEFAGPGAPTMDFIFTVCDSAAGESCPVWPGHPASAHWGLDDPSAAQGSETARERAFVTTFGHLRNRIEIFSALPFATLEGAALTAELTRIGRMDGATERARGG